MIFACLLFECFVWWLSEGSGKVDGHRDKRYSTENTLNGTVIVDADRWELHLR